MRVYIYLAFYPRRHFLTERKKESLFRRRANTFALKRERERERERSFNALRFLRLKSGASVFSPAEKSARNEMIHPPGGNDGDARVNATKMNLHDALRARETYGSTRTTVSKKRRNTTTRQGNAERIGRRRRLESDDRRGGRRCGRRRRGERRPKEEREEKEANDTLRKKDLLFVLLVGDHRRWITSSREIP